MQHTHQGPQVVPTTVQRVAERAQGYRAGQRLQHAPFAQGLRPALGQQANAAALCQQAHNRAPVVARQSARGACIGLSQPVVDQMGHPRALRQSHQRVRLHGLGIHLVQAARYARACAPGKARMRQRH